MVAITGTIMSVPCIVLDLYVAVTHVKIGCMLNEYTVNDLHLSFSDLIKWIENLHSSLWYPPGRNIVSKQPNTVNGTALLA